MIAACPALREMITQLIAQDTVSSSGEPALDRSNVAVIDRVAEWTEALGFGVERYRVPGEKDKYNLVASLGTGPGGLVLGGHADTVPWDAHRWTVDPFRATERDGRLYGLGSCDMKSFLAMAVESARRFAPARPTRPLHLVVTADEETTMSGARALAAACPVDAEAAIIGEPTLLKPVRMHKGILMDRVRLLGRSGHSSDPSHGNNALDGMHAVMGTLIELRNELAARHHNAAFRVPAPTLNLGAIHGGDNPNRICGECALSYDLRILPGMDLDGERRRLRDRIRAAVAERGFEVHFDTLFEGTPPAETRADAAIVRAAEAAAGATARAVAFGTEAAFYQRAGMDVVILGPGSIAQAHQPDEYVALEQVDAGVDLLGRLIRQHCTAAGPPAARRAV